MLVYIFTPVHVILLTCMILFVILPFLSNIFAQICGNESTWWQVYIIYFYRKQGLFTLRGCLFLSCIRYDFCYTNLSILFTSLFHFYAFSRPLWVCIDVNRVQNCKGFMRRRESGCLLPSLQRITDVSYKTDFLGDVRDFQSLLCLGNRPVVYV